MKNFQINKPKFEETKLVIITRQDISNGYQCVQSTHAIAEFAHEYPKEFKKWKKETNSIICLSIKNEEELLKLYEKLSKKTPSSSFYEPDINAFTSVCIYGTPEIRKTLSHLPLILKNK